MIEIVEIAGPALIAGLLIALTHSLLGAKVLQKGIIFIDLAIAQIAGLGLIVASHFLEYHSWSYQILALIFALAAAIFFYFVEKKSPEIQEAIIGSSFILAASLSILLLSNHPHGGDEMTHLLSGQILFITFDDILHHGPLYLIIIALWFIKPNFRNNMAFYIIFAFAITSSVQLVGIYVVFASLILPAIAARNKNNSILISWLCGIAAVILGISSAIAFDLPAGILIVISYFITSLIIGFSIKNKVA